MASTVDGRFGVFDTEALDQAIDLLVSKTDLSNIDYVVGIPEGGLIPAYAFARKAQIPALFGTRFQPAAGNFISFQEEHDGVTSGRYICGLATGSRILIVEDEISTGRTTVNCVRAIREAGSICNTVATIYATDRIETHELLAQNDVSMVAAALFSESLLTELYR
jgi:adenine/guanine phosphoribosyltransferase-like PRPP-binding protein